VSSDQPFSVEDFLDKLAANDPEISLDPTVQAGLKKLAATLREKHASTPRLLLVDDNENDSRLFENALRKAAVAMDIVRVRNGREALDYFEGNPPFSNRDHHPLPVLTFLDLRMPRINGIDVLRRLRQLPDCADLMVIVFTSSDEQSDKIEVSHYKVSAYLIKPLTVAALEKLVLQIKKSWIDPVLERRS
jgi:CheY-like chemotaxis protein